MSFLLYGRDGVNMRSCHLFQFLIFLFEPVDDVLPIEIQAELAGIVRTFINLQLDVLYLKMLFVIRGIEFYRITGDALYWAVRFIHTRYEKPIMITENGMANVDFIMSDGLVHDQQRIEFLKLYLAGLKRAANEGYPIIGYMYWSILDNFEWAEGYDKRFGLVYVNYENQERMEKDSAIWFANYIKQQQDEQS